MKCVYNYKFSSSLEALIYNHHNFLSSAVRQRGGNEVGNGIKMADENTHISSALVLLTAYYDMKEALH